MPLRATPPHMLPTCLDAASEYAAGQIARAADILVDHIDATAGQCDPSVWYMLLDLYQALGQQQAFEKLAIYFARLFQTSPPSWRTPRAAPQEVQSRQTLGRNALVVTGSINSIHPDKIRDFVLAAREFSSARIDLSRMRLEEEEVDRRDAIEGLLAIMRRLRRYKVPTLLMGENQIVDAARERIGRRGGNLATEGAYWALLFEIAQWRGQQDVFEGLALEYANLFLYCPVGFETDQAVAIAPTEETLDAAADARESSSRLLVPDFLDSAQAEVLCRQMDTRLRAEQVAQLDFGHTARVTAEAGRSLLEYAKAQEDDVNLVVMDPNEMVRCLLGSLGMFEFARLEPRSR